jgi:radical SAM/Cys-rich protein
VNGSLPDFDKYLDIAGFSPLRAVRLTTLQVNVGKVCNQACKHCHVDAGPARKESMTRETAETVVRVIRKHSIPIVDITGGAPELNPNFRFLVNAARDAGSEVMVRHNLTVQFEPGMEDLPAYFREQGVEVVASLPYFLQEQTDAQRGGGVFEASIRALRRLNDEGFGLGGALRLSLVYNPAGAFLPPAQSSIERDFKRELWNRHRVKFDRLFAITNMPISRFLDYLKRSGNHDRYLHKLVSSFNPSTVPGLMCRSMISVGWDGALYDCDFNQMAGMRLDHGHPAHIDGFDERHLGERTISTARHCFGCTAGSGSSCGGAVVPPSRAS